MIPGILDRRSVRQTTDKRRAAGQITFGIVLIRIRAIVFQPIAAIAVATLIAVVVLPTPPF